MFIIFVFTDFKFAFNRTIFELSESNTFL